MSSLTCPKCHGPMHQYERAGVVIDQCRECRGLFLDRGELERLMDAESRWSGGDHHPRHYEHHDDRRHEYRDDHHHEYRDDRGYPRKKKRKSFFEELFDD